MQLGSPMVVIVLFEAKKAAPRRKGTASEVTELVAPILPESAGYFAGVYVVLVDIPGHPEPRYRRRVYLSLAAAERVVARATMHGRRATIQLCQLVPVGGDAS